MNSLFVKKGCYGYIRNHRAVAAVRTLLFFAVSVSLYIVGYETTGTSRNLLTIVAVLGCLPACKSAVNLILFLRASGCGEELRKELEVYDGEFTVFYDMYFTSYQKNYAVSHMALKGGVLCGITEDPRCDPAEAQKHLELMIRQEGIKNVTVKIDSDRKEYVDRLSRLRKTEPEPCRDRDGLISLLYSISI